LKPDERRGQLRYRARCCLCQRHGDAGGAWMASNGRELLGKHYDKDHLSYEEITRLDLRVVTEDGEEVSYEELQGKIFRIVDRDEPSGYVVRNVETTREATTPCFLQASWRRAAETPKAPGGAR
jgi:hypothetical protein